MKIRYFFFSLILILCLTACAGTAAESPLSPEQQAFAQTQFVQQAATSAAAYARTAQPNPLSTAGMPTTPFSTGAAETGNPPLAASPTQPLPAGTFPTGAAGTVFPPTQGSAQPPSPSQTAIFTPSKTPARTATVVPTPTPTLTATPQNGWEGEWTLNFQNDDGVYISGAITVSVNGEELNAEGELSGISYQFTGRLEKNGQKVSGSWSSPLTSGSFTWTRVQGNQFGGDRDLLYGVCGARQGAQFPDPCYIAPLS